MRKSMKSELDNAALIHSRQAGTEIDSSQLKTLEHCHGISFTLLNLKPITPNAHCR